jgi:hypothetical protein
MAPETRMRVVRLGVTPDTGSVRRKVQRFDVTRRGNTLVAVHAVDPVGHVRAMLEGVRRIAGPEPKDTCARGQGESCKGEEREREFHGVPQLRESRARASAS